MIAAGTIVARSQIALARVLARSFTRHHPATPFYVLLADEPAPFIDPAREPFELISFGALATPVRDRLRFTYTQQPLSYAATPYFIEHLIDRGCTRVLFFKQESLVLGDHSPIVDRLADHDLVLTPHLLAPLAGDDRVARELNVLQSGAYNVGLVGVAATDGARRFLAWWQDRVLAECRLAVGEGVHYEQRWLDLAPAFFERTHLVRDPRFNIGHWNLPERDADVDDARLMRFSGYDPARPDAITRYTSRLSLAHIPRAAAQLRRYHDALVADGWRETHAAKYAWAAFDNGVVIPDIVRAFYVSLGDDVAKFGDPRATSGPDSFYRWLTSPAAGATATNGFTQLWAWIYGHRADVRETLPPVPGRETTALVDWIWAHGAAETGIPAELCPPRASRLA